MRTLALWLVLEIGTALAPSLLQAAPVHQWSQQFGDVESQSGRSVAMDLSGNVIVTGEFEGTIDFGGGPLTSAGNFDTFLAKFDADGNHVWSKSFGDADNHIGWSVATDGSGNIVITGVFGGSVDFGGGPLTSTGSYDIFVAKFDANGNHLWSQRFGDADLQIGVSVTTDGPGNVIVTGFFYGTVDFGGGPLTSVSTVDDIFVAKFDANGNHLWSKRFGDADSQQVGSVAADGSGNIVITGIFFATIDFGGGLLTSAGGGDIFVAKFDVDGNHVWSKRFGNNQGQLGMWAAADGPGNIVITGFFDGSLDFGGGPLTSTGNSIYLVKFAPNGNHIWSNSFGDHGYQIARSVVVDNSGNITITGDYSGTLDFGGGPLTGGFPFPDIFIAQFDVGGSHLWSKTFGDPEYQIGYSVAADASGNVVLTGSFGGTVDFGGGPLTSAGLDDIFLAKFVEGPLPVLITKFDATGRNGTVVVTWDVWSDEALESFALYRRDDERTHAIVIAQGPFDPATRSYVDASVEPGTSYHYELLIHTQDGDDIRSPVATVTVPALRATLGQNFPNPFKPATTIEYTLSESSSAVLGIYDAGGRLVTRLDQGVRDPGTHRAEWDGRDAGGRAVGSGVYFYRLEGAPRVAPRKMVLVR